jgi:hypothetical protein
MCDLWESVRPPPEERARRARGQGEGVKGEGILASAARLATGRSLRRGGAGASGRDIGNIRGKVGKPQTTHRGAGIRPQTPAIPRALGSSGFFVRRFVRTSRATFNARRLRSRPGILPYRRPRRHPDLRPFRARHRMRHLSDTPSDFCDTMRQVLAPKPPGRPHAPTTPYLRRLLRPPVRRGSDPARAPAAALAEQPCSPVAGGCGIRPRLELVQAACCPRCDHYDDVHRIHRPIPPSQQPFAAYASHAPS